MERTGGEKDRDGERDREGGEDIQGEIHGSQEGIMKNRERQEERVRERSGKT